MLILRFPEKQPILDIPVGTMLSGRYRSPWIHQTQTLPSEQVSSAPESSVSALNPPPPTQPMLGIVLVMPGSWKLFIKAVLVPAETLSGSEALVTFTHHEPQPGA